MIHGEDALLLQADLASTQNYSSPTSPTPPPPPLPPLSFLKTLALLAFSFANGNLLSTYFLLTLPLESERIAGKEENLKSVYLGLFIAVAGITQLICPVVGLYSDSCTLSIGKRRPFMLLGGFLGAIGLGAQRLGSLCGEWKFYGFGFIVAMVGLNTVFSSMIGLVPDLVPPEQTGTANGLQAVLSVSGALFGFVYYYSWLEGEVTGMYDQYIAVFCSTLLLTCWSVREQDPLACEYSGQGRLMFAKLKSQDIFLSYYVSPTEHSDFFYVTVSR